ncbi:hypothetical protein CVD27_22715 [Neobacillus cucumis]|uniref:Uncharacterized protein n=1 Tax=Neobacillus cucumis TaxID=1740721 RepID=A0A2N5H8T3_9BACI|nr:hypothetical protein CVD27_22715 [Neobacillus cucumis]
MIQYLGLIYAAVLTDGIWSCWFVPLLIDLILGIPKGKQAIHNFNLDKFCYFDCKMIQAIGCVNSRKLVYFRSKRKVQIEFNSELWSIIWRVIEYYLIHYL